MAVSQKDARSGENAASSSTPRPLTSAAPDLPPAGAAGPDTAWTCATGIRAVEARLAETARRSWRVLPPADIAAAVDAGVLAGGTRDAECLAFAARAAAEVGEAAATVQRQGLPPTATSHADWRPFGQVIPVLAGSPGAGASVLAAVLADAIQRERRAILLVDAADPVRSGLSMAARSAGPCVRGPHPAVCLRYSWRARSILAQMETCLPAVAPGMVPPPRFWHPGVSLDATVVDVGHDSWRVASHPLSGAGEWLRRGSPAPSPVLVVRPSRPSLMRAEQVVARLEPWIVAGVAAAPVALVVMGARNWPSGVVGSAGRRIAALVPDAMFVPYATDIAVGGVGPDVTPARLRAAVRPLLRRWGLAQAGTGTRS